MIKMLTNTAIKTAAHSVPSVVPLLSAVSLTAAFHGNIVETFVRYYQPGRKNKAGGQAAAALYQNNNL